MALVMRAHNYNYVNLQEFYQHCMIKLRKNNVRQIKSSGLSSNIIDVLKAHVFLTSTM